MQRRHRFALIALGLAVATFLLSLVAGAVNAAQAQSAPTVSQYLANRPLLDRQLRECEDNPARARSAACVNAAAAAREAARLNLMRDSRRNRAVQQQRRPVREFRI